MGFFFFTRNNQIKLFAREINSTFLGNYIWFYNLVTQIFGLMGEKKKNWLTLLVKWLQTTDEIKNSAKIMRD